MEIITAWERSRLLAIGKTCGHAEVFRRRLSNQMDKAASIDACSHRCVLERKKNNLDLSTYHLIFVEVENPAQPNDYTIIETIRAYSEKTHVVAVVGSGLRSSKMKYYLAGADHCISGFESDRPRPGFFLETVCGLASLQLQLDSTRMRIVGKHVKVDISFIEVELIKAFIRSKNHVLSHDEIASAMGLNIRFYDQRTMEKSISRLRGKIKKNFHSVIIHSVRGYGYRLDRGAVSLTL